MPIISRAVALRGSAGRRSVIYRDARGTTFEAVVLAAGTAADELDLRIPSQHVTLEDVPQAVTLKDTEVWYLPRP